MRMRLVSLGFVLLAQAAPTGQATELRFDWPRDLVARIDTVRTRERQTPRPRSTTFRASCRMRVAPHPEGMSITFDEFTLDGVSEAERASIVDAVALMNPNLIVGPDGDLRRIADIASLRQSANQLFAPLLSAGQLPAGLKSFLDQVLTDEVLTTTAGQEWEVLVGAWKGLPLTTEPFSAELEAPSPLFGDVKLPMKVTGRLIERTECTRGGIPRECAVFETRSTVDQAAMEPLLRRLMRGLPAQDVRYERIDVLTVARIGLETQTMVPHELTTTRTVDMVVDVPRQGRTTGRQIDRRTSRFLYQ